MYNLKRMKTIRIHKEYMQSLFICINYYNATTCNTGKNVLAPEHRIIFHDFSLMSSYVLIGDYHMAFILSPKPLPSEFYSAVREYFRQQVKASLTCLAHYRLYSSPFSLGLYNTVDIGAFSLRSSIVD